MERTSLNIVAVNTRILYPIRDYLLPDAVKRPAWQGGHWAFQGTFLKAETVLSDAFQLVTAPQSPMGFKESYTPLDTVAWLRFQAMGAVDGSSDFPFGDMDMLIGTRGIEEIFAEFLPQLIEAIEARINAVETDDNEATLLTLWRVTTDTCYTEDGTDIEHSWEYLGLADLDLLEEALSWDD